MKVIRDYFYAQDFLEVDAPLLIKANSVEAHIDPLEVEVRDHLGKKLQRYLHTSPEIYHKRLLCLGAQKIFQISHVFRDGEVSKQHQPEFSLLEWYRAHGSVSDLIQDCEVLFRNVAHAVLGKTIVSYGDHTIDLAKPFEQIEMADLWQKYAQIDLRSVLERMKDGEKDALVTEAKAIGESLRDQADFEDAFHQIMFNKIEPNIGKSRPCVVLKWPNQMAALAQTCQGDPLFADRFEIYCGGLELANAFKELIDPVEQRKRFECDLLLRQQMGKNPVPMPENFLDGMVAMPPAAGIALGIDRLIMLIVNAKSINEIFPIDWFET